MIIMVFIVKKKVKHIVIGRKWIVDLEDLWEKGEYIS